MKFIWFGILPIAIIAAIFIPIPPSIKDSPSTNKVEKFMKYDKCIEDVIIPDYK